MSDTEREVRDAKDEVILALLGKLAVFYWRPDFTAEQAKQLYADYVDDLNRFALRDIKNAITEYRQNGENRFFPTSGQLIDVIIDKAEVDGHGYTDRYDALHRRRSAAETRGLGEMQRVIAKAEGREPAPPIALLRPSGPSKPLCSDLPRHPFAKQLPPPEPERPFSEVLKDLPPDNWYARQKLRT